MAKASLRFLAALLLLSIAEGASPISHRASNVPVIREDQGKIMVTSGGKVILFDRSSKAIIWQSTGLKGALCVVATSNGHFLVCEGESIARIDADGKLISRTAPNFKMTTDVKPLPNDHLLVSDGPGGTVAEMDWSGNTTWSVKGLHHPSEAIRLDNGNTLVADGTAALKEFDVNGTLLRTTWLKRWVGAVLRLSDGSMLLGESFGVELLNSSNHSLWWLDLPTRVTGVQQISSTDFLISEPDAHRVAAIDVNGTVRWELTGLRYPWRAIYIQ